MSWTPLPKSQEAQTGSAPGAATSPEKEKQQVIDILAQRLPFDLAERITYEARVVEVKIETYQELHAMILRLRDEPSQDWVIHCSRLMDWLMMWADEWAEEPEQPHAPHQNTHDLHVAGDGHTADRFSKILESWQKIRAHQLVSAKSRLTLNQLRICPNELCHPIWELGGTVASEDAEQIERDIKTVSVVGVQLAAHFFGPPRHRRSHE